MKRTNLFFQLLISIFLISIVSGCGEDDPTPTMATIELTMAGNGSGTIANGRISNGRVNGTVEITDFQISIRDIIFKTDADDDGVSDDSTEVAFRGPFAIDLFSETGALEQSLGDAEIPFGEYKEIRFKFHKTRDVAQDHPLYDRSIYVKGTVDGVPFEMWHDTSENLDIGRSTGVVVDENGVSLSVTFTIDQFLNSSESIDLSQAADNDGDGVIEINPDDDDDNKDFADALKDNIKAAADLMDR